MKDGQVYGGEISQLLKGDVFRIVLQIPEAQQIQVTDQVTDQDINVNLEVLKLLNVFTGEHTGAELMPKLSLCHRPKFSNLYMDLPIICSDIFSVKIVVR